MKILPLILLLAASLCACHRGRDASLVPHAPERKLVFAFYNMENLWDPADDPAHPGDDEFTPGGPMRWTEERLERKLASIARAVGSMNELSGPDLIGVCEVENRAVLERLATEFLPEHGYQVAHAESPDERGIDVALLYRASAMKLERVTMHRVDLGEGERPTRDIMEASFTKDGRSFTVLVNHWPSRRGGESASAPRRKIAAQSAADIIDSLTALDPAADIVLMGDLNDEPFDDAVTGTLGAREYEERMDDARMINTAAPVARVDTIGSYYYRGDWETIDQIMLSRAGALDGKGITLYQTSETVFTPEFLRDPKADPIARPPYHTYIRGTYYIGGPSDHFPVMLEVGWREK